MKRPRAYAVIVATTSVVFTVGGVTGMHASAAAPLCFGKTPTMVGTAGADNLVGSAGGDVIYAGDGSDVVHGGGGNDLICGGNGDDTLYGDTGLNKLDGGDGNDNLVDGTTVVGGVGVFDTVLFYHLPATTPVTANLATGKATAGGVTYTMTGIEGVVGTPGNDHLTGNSGINLLYGIGGNDVLNGAGGFDYAGFLVGTVNANLGTGRATGAAEGTDTLQAMEGLLASYSPSTLTGNNGPNVLLSGDGSDTLHGSGGNDILAGELGSDTLYGEAGNDYLIGGGGDDNNVGGPGVDQTDYSAAHGPISVNLATGHSTGDTGADLLSTVEGVIGGAFNDTLTGDGKSNLLQGGGGNDTLTGNGGNDVLRGGPGVDKSNGGAGSDSCTTSETVTACETTSKSSKSSTTPAQPLNGLQRTLKGRASAAQSAATVVAGLLVTDFSHPNCVDTPAPTVQAYPPQIGSPSGRIEPASWTPYLYIWDQVNGGWNTRVAGYPLPQSSSTGVSAAYQFGLNTQLEAFPINSAGYFRVADYVYWPQSNRYALEWAGAHVVDYVSDFTGPAAYYADWCQFPLQSPFGPSRAQGAAHPGLDTPPPAPSWAKGTRIH